MAPTNDRLRNHADDLEREARAGGEEPAAERAPGLGRFAGSAATYFAVAIVLALVFALTIGLSAR